jgi:hypothetical protein
MVKSAYSTRVGASLDALEKSPNTRISSIITGTSLRGNAVKMFDQGIRAGFNSYYEENGKWPTGRAKQDIVDGVVDKAEKFIETQVRIGGSSSPTSSAPAQPAAAPKPASGGPVKITTDAEYNSLKPGTSFVGPDGVTRRKP